jgi:hypothetical protein
MRVPGGGSWTRSRRGEKARGRRFMNNSPNTRRGTFGLKRVERGQPVPPGMRHGGVKAVRDEFNIIDRRGDKLRCVFLLDLGASGVA